MSRTVLWLLCGGWLVCAAAGCSHLDEKRTIARFNQALEREDLQALRSASSEGFEQKALRQDEAVDDLKVLNLPKGETSIVSVDEVSPHERRVTVTVGETKRKLQYRLKRDEATGRWVVDDILMRQRRDQLQVSRSVTEQMDLLLSFREFLAAWDDGGREEVLAVATPELAELLGELPPAFLARVTRRVIGERSGDRGAVQPEAQLDEDVAVVTLPRSAAKSTGRMVVSMRLLEGRWKVSDVAVESRDEREHIPSVQKLATVLRASVEFLRAYEAEDRETLARVCTRKFYAAGLGPADLSAVVLPSGDVPPDDYQVRLQDRRADFLVTTPQDVVKISLVREDDDAGGLVGYRIEEVTLYEADGGQERRLSSLFTARPIVEIFGEAVLRGDGAMLRKLSTADFNRRVWDRLGDAPAVLGRELESSPLPLTLDDLPLEPLNVAPPEVVSTTYRGAVTEVGVRHGRHMVTYVLRERSGEVRVDDVLTKLPDRPASLKETIELVLPARSLAAALAEARLDAVVPLCAGDFNRLVWRQVDAVPVLAVEAAEHLRAPVTTIESTSNEVLVVLGDEQWGARVALMRNQSGLAIEEILLIAGPEPHQQARLKQTLRTMIAHGHIRPRRQVVPASHEAPATAAAPRGGQPAAFVPGDTDDLEPSDSAFDPPPGVDLRGDGRTDFLIRP